MGEQFNEDDREDLMERGFNNGQIEYLESLEMNTEGLYSDICKIMDDFGDTPEQIIESYEEANNNNQPQEEAPQQGGKRRKSYKKGKRTRRTRKGYKKGKKTRRTKRSRKSYKKR